MNSLYRDRRLHYLLLANTFSSIGTGITMTAIPWLFVQKSGGETAFGYMTTAITIMMFLLTPYIGMWIDRFSRKKILLVGEVIGFSISLLFALLGRAGEYKVWHLAVLFASGSLYYFLIYPTLFAFNQELFVKEQYKQLNGMMEIQGQLATVISGGAASVMIDHIPFSWILSLDALTYVLAFLCIWLIPYKRSFVESKDQSLFREKMLEGYRYMKERPSLFWFLLASFMPFIGVMMTNYLHPIYIADVLKQGSSVYGIQSMVYGIGAAIAGLVTPILLKRMAIERSVALSVGIYAVSITMFLLCQQTAIFYVLVVLTAFANAGARVARSSLMMESIPNDKMGRVDSLFRALGFMIRTLLLSVFTGAVAAQHILLPYAILNILLIISTLAVIKFSSPVKKEHHLSI
ncbi:MFS transporter [Anoxybacteroides rupiense]|uniref:MFS transporter n=1 Tax=Anoxybacteroides rupiense TaxID=311460 RepID=UPI001F08C82C|nr:MFS transporter [Anoxybacillus rupiensis]